VVLEELKLRKEWKMHVLWHQYIQPLRLISEFKNHPEMIILF